MNPGEYTQPFPRKTIVNCPVVSGYVTARLYASETIPPTVSGAQTQSYVTFENVGGTTFSVRLRETDDRSITGMRYNLGSEAYVVPGGYQTQTITGRLPFLEVYCTGTTTGQLRLQLESQRQWRELGFDRTDSYYPTSLYQARTYPSAI